LYSKRLTGSALFESLFVASKMLRTSTIIVITQIMVEVLKMNLLLWCLREAARMAMTRDVVLITRRHYSHVPKALDVPPATGLIEFSREWRRIALQIRAVA
jgi:hypothetical protein